jgi:uncharacterized membrane protein
MDLISFVLGVVTVLSVIGVVVIVIAFIRVNKQKKEIEMIRQYLAREIENQMRDRDIIIDDVYRTMDSRLDKLESKLSSRKA